MAATSAAEVPPHHPAVQKLKRYLQVVTMMGVWAAALLGSAGRIGWLRAWICLATYSVTMGSIGLLVRRANPGLLAARSKFNRRETKRFDKFFFAVYLPLLMIQPVVAGLDAVRFRWSAIPFSMVYLGLILFAAATFLVGWTLMVNPHAESTVRIQSDRDHKVVTSGPYRMVRHPMYVGSILIYPATALILGSMWALAIAGVIDVLFVFRTALEDRTLQRELRGYKEFTQTTRFRLVPGLW